MKQEEMKGKPLLSVALCTYNGERFILEQLYSIINQQLPIDEIIICDDGSTDSTLLLIDSISKKCHDIQWRVIKNPQQLGVTQNFEKALSLCSGDIVFLSDQDDIWESDKTKKIINYFNQHENVDLVFSDARLIDENGLPISDKTLFDVCGLNQLKKQWEAGLQFEIENVIQRLLGATFGIRKKFLQQSLPFDYKIANYHDGQLAMHSVAEDCNGMIDECLIKYRIHRNNVVGLGGINNIALTSIRSASCEYANILEPRKINPYFLTNKANNIRDRVKFFQRRNRYYQSINGKIMLLMLVFQYRKYYKGYWFDFLSSDFLYGICKPLRNKIVHHTCIQR